MAETTLINLHHFLPKETPFYIPIGRVSKWGNPFTHMEGTRAKYICDSREESVYKYMDYINNNQKLLDSLHELWGMTLGCTCKPKDCHGDVLIELINEKFAGQEPFRIVVAGGRDFNDYDYMCEKLDESLAEKVKTHRIIIVSGAAKGADKLGEKFAKERGYLIHRFPADWEKHGNSAGFIRNSDMAKAGNACACFWDKQSSGTKHMIDLAKKHDKPTKIFYY